MKIHPKGRPRQPPIRWNVTRASSEFGVDRKTLAKNLTVSDVQPGPDGLFSTADICRAVFGDHDSEKLRETRERADKLALENAQTRGELGNIKELATRTARGLNTIRTTIQSLPIEPEQKDEICRATEDAFRTGFGLSGNDSTELETSP